MADGSTFEWPYLSNYSTDFELLFKLKYLTMTFLLLLLLFISLSFMALN